MRTVSAFCFCVISIYATAYAESAIGHSREQLPQEGNFQFSGTSEEAIVVKELSLVIITHASTTYDSDSSSKHGIQNLLDATAHLKKIAFVETDYPYRLSNEDRKLMEDWDIPDPFTPWGVFKKVDQCPNTLLSFERCSNGELFTRKTVAEKSLENLEMQKKYYFSGNDVDAAILSDDGRHQISTESKKIFMAGGLFHNCFCRTVRDLARNSKSDALNLLFVTDAIYDQFLDPEKSVIGSDVQLFLQRETLEEKKMRLGEKGFLDFLDRNFFDTSLGFCPSLQRNNDPRMKRDHIVTNGFEINYLYDGQTAKQAGRGRKVVNIRFIRSSELGSQLSEQ